MCTMRSSPINLTYEVEVQPGEKLTLPEPLVESVGAGRWMITVQPAAPDGAFPPVRDHNAFLNSYALIWPEDRIDHVSSHGVEPKDVEDVCFGRSLVQRAGPRERIRSGLLRPRTNDGRTVSALRGDPVS